MKRETLVQTMQLSHHARQRAAQRNLSPAELRYVIRHGQRFHRAGALIFFLRDRDVPEADRGDDERRRLVGTAVVLSSDGRQVLTAWRNRRNGLQRIKRKVEYSLNEGELPWTG